MSSSPAAGVSVVICTYDEVRWAALVRAVTSVVHARPGPGEVIVVVDHNPALLERAQGALPVARAVANCGPRGLSGARNSGIATAQAPVVAFLDDDAVADPDWLTRLATPYREPEVVAVGGRALPAWENARPRWWPEEFDWVVGCSYRGMPQGRQSVRNLMGCNMSFRRDVFDAVGTFTPGIGRLGTKPVGCEETELCIRLSQRWPGARIVYEPDAVVHHEVPAARASWAYFRRRCFAEGQSKAMVAAARGQEAALATERGYVVRALPAGIARSLAAAATERRLECLGRAVSIAAGVAVAGAGYAHGTWQHRAGNGLR
jgi:O-antigen biosynthesis protein